MDAPDGVLYPFISQHLPHHSYTQCHGPINEAQLQKSALFPLLIAFDEWIANTDRRFDNILFDLNEPGFSLIDFGHAMGGPDWTRATLRPRKHYGNAMLELHKVYPNSKSSENIIAKARQLHMIAVRLDFLSLEVAMHVDSGLYSHPENVRAVIQFLRNRSYEVTSILQNQVFNQSAIIFDFNRSQMR